MKGTRIYSGKRAYKFSSNRFSIYTPSIPEVVKGLFRAKIDECKGRIKGHTYQPSIAWTKKARKLFTNKTF